MQSLFFLLMVGAAKSKSQKRSEVWLKIFEVVGVRNVRG